MVHGHQDSEAAGRGGVPRGGRRRSRERYGCALALALCATAATATGAPRAAEPLSDRAVSYRISVRLDPGRHTLEGEQSLTWRNTTTRPADELRFHLYLNAFKNDRTTFMKESGGIHRGNRMREDGWGWIDLLSLRRHDGADLLPAAEFIRPDDANAGDETVLRVPLAEPVAPGATIDLDMAFSARLPRVFARTGYKGNYHFVAQWFPKIGVLEEAGWNCHQFHYNSEFFADFGTYDVSITVPSEFVVGATGVRSGSPRDNGDGTSTHRFVQEDVHDFAWTADPRFVREVRHFRYEEQRDRGEEERVARAMGIAPDSEELRLSDVEVTLLIQPEHRHLIERHFAAVFHAIRYFGTWYGRYPYPNLTVVDPAYLARGSGGMEYPTLITAGVNYFAPSRRQSPESVTIHEFGHQYWYGMVANNEFEESFLDEGFNSYSEGLILDRAYGPDHGTIDLAPGIPWVGVPLMDIPPGPDPEDTTPRHSLSERVVDFLLMRPFGPSDDLTLNAFRDLPFLNHVGDAPIDQVTSERRRYLVAPQADVLARRSWEYATRDSYGLNSYSRTALMLRTLEGVLGKDRMTRIMRAYYQRYRFRHPKVDDFIATVNEVAGEPLDAFFAQTIFGSDVIDYAVDKVSSKLPGTGSGIFGPPGARREVTREEAEALDAAREEDTGADRENEVVIKRLGGIRWPQTVAIEYADVPARRIAWDGEYRWMRHEETGPRIDAVRVDPEETLSLDVNRTNNVRSRERNPLAGWKWWSRTLQWMQHVVYFYSGLS